MEKRITRHFGHSAFVAYLCLFILIPFTHSHAAEVLSESAACEAGHGPEHLPFFSVVQCCELHETGHTNSDEHHIHFLTDDQGRAARHNLTDTSLAPQVLAAFDEDYLKYSPRQVTRVVVSTADFYQDVLRSYSSGLSPPIV